MGWGDCIEEVDNSSVKIMSVRWSVNFVPEQYWEQENRGHSIYLMEVEKYGKPTVTFKEHSSRKQNLTSHDQSQFTKLSRKTDPTNRTKQKIPVPKKAQASRLSDYLNTGPISFLKPHDARCRYPLFRGRSFCREEEGREAWEKTKPNLHRSPCPPSLGSNHPCMQNRATS